MAHSAAIENQAADDMGKMIDDALKHSGPADLIGAYNIYKRQIGDWQLIMLTYKYEAPAMIARKYLYMPRTLAVADGRSLLSALNDARAQGANWDTFDDEYVLELASILSVVEPQNFGVRSIHTVADINGVEIDSIAPDLTKAITSPTKFTDSQHRHAHLSYFYNPCGGQVIRMVLVFSAESGLPVDYTMTIMEDSVGKYYRPR